MSQYVRFAFHMQLHIYIFLTKQWAQSFPIRWNRHEQIPLPLTFYNIELGKLSSHMLHQYSSASYAPFLLSNARPAKCGNFCKLGCIERCGKLSMTKVHAGSAKVWLHSVMKVFMKENINLSKDIRRISDFQEGAFSVAVFWIVNILHQYPAKCHVTVHYALPSGN